MADTIAKNTRIEKDWKTEEVETLIHHYENEPMLWDARLQKTDFLPVQTVF